MIRFLSIFSLVFSISLQSLAFQEEQDIRFVNVTWQVGSSKTISHYDSTIVMANDTIMMASGSLSQYEIIIDAHQDTVYEIRFRQIQMDENISMESEMMDVDPLQKMMQDLIMEMQNSLMGLEYSFLVDQNTAMAFAVTNEEELSQNIEDMVFVVMNKLISQSDLEISDSKKAEIQDKSKKYIQAQMPDALQTMMNSFNYIFQGYSTPFVMNEEFVMDVEVYDIDQLQHKGVTNNAKMIINNKIEEDEFYIYAITEYDKEMAYQNLVASQGMAGQVSIDDFDVLEGMESVFDLKDNWLKKNISYVDAEMGKITMRNRTIVVIE